MQSILDHTTDLTGTETHRLTQCFDPPEYVKQADHDQLIGGEEPLQRHVYADQTKRAFPCHSKAATWMSALFFGDKKAELGSRSRDIEQRLRNSANFWQIGEDVNKLWEKMATAEAKGHLNLPDADFAFLWEGEDGSKERRYPLRNAAEVKVASEWFDKYADQFTFMDRHRVAQRIIEKAAAYGAAVQNQERLNMTAGYGYCPSEEVADAWVKRAALVQRSNKPLAEQTMKIADTIRERHIAIHDGETRVKMAKLMDDFDAETRLKSLYDDGLERPEEVMFKITEKTAQDYANEHVSLTNGNIYEKTALEQLSLDNVRSWLGDDVADEVAIAGVHIDGEKLAELLPTLPRPDADMFTRMANEAGISVTLREKTSADLAGVSQVRDYVAGVGGSNGS